MYKIYFKLSSFELGVVSKIQKIENVLENIIYLIDLSSKESQ